MALKTARTESAGGVVYRRVDGQVELALVGRVARGIWALPKGTPRRGETREATALREVREETGLQVRLVAPLGDIQYWFVDGGVRFHKTVVFYLMEAIGGDVSAHDAEYDAVAWFPAAEALHRATYASEREVVERALARLDGEIGAEDEPLSPPTPLSPSRGKGGGGVEGSAGAATPPSLPGKGVGGLGSPPPGKEEGGKEA